MSSSRVRPLMRGVAGAGLIMALAMAILVMHSVIAHCATGHEATGQEIGGSHGQSTMHSAHQSLDDRDTIGGAGDCDPHDHACVFIRAGEPAVVILGILVLAWGFPIPPLLRSIRVLRTLRAGRPPPWAMPTHLQLQVIRC
ncbi:hypothetical protein QSJ19_13770 [Gordonia sp. ABSL11-1]|uniref:hypothetical protein n=1 Tax=Gordonia sp. ABSL11-1 TaxID=3053924 RepID=UPI0025729AEE|nr:hypothetical protein [Gordonia sp. ABSL11-1]MDL9946636.1 hypothetical protein [Gordonia sp. ABSL11-1]